MTGGDRRTDPSASSASSASSDHAEPMSGHALSAPSTRTLWAIAIVSGVVLLFVIGGTILRALN